MNITYPIRSERTGVVRFVKACPVVLALAFTWQGEAAERLEKIAGSFFGPPIYDSMQLTNSIRGSSLPVVAPAQERPLLSASPLPALQVKILMEPGSALNAPTDKFLTERSTEFKQASVLSRQLTLKNSGREVIESALASPGVMRIEVARPPSISPVLPQSGFGRMRPFNLDAQITHLVPHFLSTFSDVTEYGRTILAAVFDEGAIRASHLEFQDNRVAVRSTQQLSEHSTHVAGTMAALGVRRQATGMAKEMKLLSFDWENDLNALHSVAPEIRISNHSYGPSSGWSYEWKNRVWLWWGNRAHSAMEDSRFGKYTAENQVLDEILHKFPHLLTFVAAGNDRSGSPERQPIHHFAIKVDPQTYQASWEASTELRNPDGFDTGGLDTVTGLGLSKNAICIGAIHDVDTPGANIVTTDFSGWGPTDDGRIKPDLVANGHNLLSTSMADDQAYIQMPGTSMASPTAGGIAALLVEQFSKVHNRWPSAAEIKAILIHSATDSGVPGPDPIYGWGSINALSAGRIIAGNDGAMVVTDTLSQGGEIRRQFVAAKRGSSIRATLVWTDPPGSANSGGLDDAAPVLVNDVDLVLIAPDGQRAYPYSLNRANPMTSSRNGANRVDNVEVVDAVHILGEWEVVVTAGSRFNGEKQDFALILTGLDAVR